MEDSRAEVISSKTLEHLLQFLTCSAGGFFGVPAPRPHNIMNVAISKLYLLHMNMNALNGPLTDYTPDE